jgi:hypothetical protein
MRRCDFYAVSPDGNDGCPEPAVLRIAFRSCLFHLRFPEDSEGCWRNACGSPMSLRKTKTIKVRVDLENLAFLEALVGHGYSSVTQVLEHLAHSAADGIRRPGSWERGWVLQAFGDGFEENVEQDPERMWNVRPIKKGGEQ